MAEGLPTNTLQAVMEDREGSLWAAGGGVFRLQGGGILKAYTAADGLPNEVVWCIFRDKAGALFAGTDSGLAKADARGWKLVPGTGNFQVRSIVQGPDGALYLGGGPEVLRVEPRTGVRRFGSGQGVVTSGRIFRLLFDHKGDLWVATDGGGLLKGMGRGGRWCFERQSVPGGSPTERFDDLFEDAGGRLWTTGEKGLAMWDGAIWRRFTTQDGLRNDHVSYVHGTRSGDLLVSYFDPFGLCRAVFSQGVFKVQEHLDQTFPREKQIYSFGEDFKGNLWAGTGQGLDMVARNGRVEHFGRGEGLISEDTNAMAILPEANGDVWFGTGSGLARFDASAYKGAPGQPATVILDCRLGKDRVPVFAAERLRVSHGSNTFMAKFAGLSFIREGAVQHQVRLEGLETEWHFSETREERYPALPHGSYRFDARSRIGLGEWGPIASFEFEVLPAWWQTWWFRVLGLLGGAGAIVLIIRWRVDALHHRNRILEEMVGARTREVEAKAKELEQMIEALRNQSLTDPLTGLRNRRYLGVCMPEDVAQVQRVHRDVVASRSERVLLNIDLVFLMVDIDHFKFVNDHYGHAAGDQVLQQVAEILRKASRDSDTVVRWGGEEFLVVARNAARRESGILAERIRAQMAEHVFLLEDGTTLHRTCSVGFTFFPFVPENPNFLPWEQVLDIADHCLFAAKRGGRDAWVGLFPREGGDAIRIKAGLPVEIQALLDSGEITVATSLPDSSALDWNLKA
jgi:diguanylate cyclase (GGDEF)-like protein